MKRILFIFLLLSSLIIAQETHSQTITFAADTTRSSAYTAGYYGFSNTRAKPVLFMTPAAITTDSIYIEVYDPTSSTYKRLESATGSPVLYIVEANRTYYFDTSIFEGIRQFKLANVSDVEASARTYTIIEIE